MRKQGNENVRIPISRRTFLKGRAAAAAVVGASAMFGCSPSDVPETTVEAEVSTSAESEKPVDLPDARYNRICIKGLTHTHRMYSKDRLKYPLRRVGERGAGEWEQISWEEAIQEIAEKWKGYQAEYGTQSVGIYVGSVNYATCSGEGLGCGTTCFMNTIGATNISASADMARGTGAQPVIGIGPLVTGNEAADLLNAKTIICWGANPVNSQQQSTHFMMEAQEKGTKLIVIDPTFTATAAKADIYVPIRPSQERTR